MDWKRPECSLAGLRGSTDDRALVTAVPSRSPVGSRGVGSRGLGFPQCRAAGRASTGQSTGSMSPILGPGSPARRESRPLGDRGSRAGDLLDRRGQGIGFDGREIGIAAAPSGITISASATLPALSATEARTRERIGACRRPTAGRPAAPGGGSAPSAIPSHLRPGIPGGAS